MNTSGVIVGIISFGLIGLFHVIVLKAEYYFTKNIWPLFGIAGLVLLWFSLYTEDMAVSCVLAITGIMFLWSIKELFEQEERVRKGWFPANPKRTESRKRGTDASAVTGSPQAVRLP